jgi:hypothetical protein
VAKKDDPNYEQVRAHVPKQLARRFKQYCLDEDIDYSEGLEKVLTSFFAEIDRLKKNLPRKSGQTKPK